MKILLVNKFFNRGAGAETVFFETLDGLTAAGYEVVPFAMHDDRNAASPWSTHFTRRRDYVSGPWSTRLRDATAAIYSRESRCSLRELLRIFTPDLAHVHNVYHQLTMSIVDELSEEGIPTVMTLHDYKVACPNYQLLAHDGRCQRCVNTRQYWHAVRHRCLKGSIGASAIAAAEAYVNRFRGAYEKVDRFISPSSFLRDVVIRAGVRSDRVDVIANPVDARPVEHVPSGTPTFAYFGRLAPEKGLDVLLDAAPHLDSGTRIVVCGTGPLEGRLRARALSEGLPVEFLGHVDVSQLDAVLACATAAVLPARWFENCPMSVLEAGARGVPMIASNLGGIPELIRDGVDGILVPPDEPHALAIAMNGLARDRSRAHELGARARARVSVRNSRAVYITRILDSYARASAPASTHGVKVVA